MPFPPLPLVEARVRTTLRGYVQSLLSLEDVIYYPTAPLLSRSSISPADLSARLTKSLPSPPPPQTEPGLPLYLAAAIFSSK